MPKTCGECPHKYGCSLYVFKGTHECPARTGERQSEAALRVAREALGMALSDFMGILETASYTRRNEIAQAAITKINSILDGGED